MTGLRTGAQNAAIIQAFNDRVTQATPAPVGVAMDDSSNGVVGFKQAASGLPADLLSWYALQGFIGYQTCAMISQHWLVDKACTMPARDAIRHGFEIQAYDDGKTGVVLDDITDALMRADRKYRLAHNMAQFVRMGRVFGIRVAFFKVESADAGYYEKPFNADGITPGSYRGISQVDPYWCIPMLSGESAADPSSINFYEPEWWLINGKKYHRSHLCIFRNAEVPDILKPMYMYGGVSVPQKIFERVYAAERTANEGPQLAMTKRTMVWNTDLSALYANEEKFSRHMRAFAEYRDNYGMKINDLGDTMQQFDTTLSDLDAVIMTQYQIVAAAAGVPATKLLGTTPKGFNATGEYEAESYHEELETVQANDLTPFVNRHHLLVLRSDIEPARGLAPGAVRVEIDWRPVDSPTAKEYAEINLLNAQTDASLVTSGAIDGMDVRTRLRGDPNSGYADLAEIVLPEIPDDGTPDAPAAFPDA